MLLSGTESMLSARRIAVTVVVLAGWMAQAPGSARAQEQSAAEKERDLIALLRSDAAPAEKAVACKHLAVYGSSEAVPELAKLLPDEKLASWARIALEAIPGHADDEAHRKAHDTGQGKLLAGAINSIGVRRDALAVEPLAVRLSDQDAEIASAAAVALGRIGNAAAAGSLRAALRGVSANVRSAVAEGCILCAERHLS